MLEMTYKLNTIETIGDSSIRITVSKEIREILGVGIGDNLYVGLPDADLQELAILEISTEKVDSVQPTPITQSGRIGISNSLSNLVEINNYKKIGLVLTNKKIFLFVTDAMKQDIKEKDYAEKDKSELKEKARLIVEKASK